MCRIQGHGKDNPMDDRQEASKPSGQECTKSGSIVTRYHRLFHRLPASLDLETAFKNIKISQDIKPDLCQDCRTEKCICPAFKLGMPCSSASSTPTNTNIDDEEIPELVANTLSQVFYPPAQSPSDEEADREVAAIFNVLVYYWVRSCTSCRCRYYMYNSLDIIEESCRGKRRCEDSPHVQ